LHPAVISLSYATLVTLRVQSRKGCNNVTGDDVMWHSIGHRGLGRRDDIAAATSALMADILGSTKRESAVLERGHRQARIEELMQAGARVDAALELIALELPQWQLCRIAYDDGEWSCALSRCRDLPDWLDRPAEGRHADLALAILNALLSAQLGIEEATTPSLPRAAQTASVSLDAPLCCDHFS